MTVEELTKGWVIKYYPKRGGSYKIYQFFDDRKDALNCLEKYREQFITYTGKGARKPKVDRWIFKKVIYNEEEKEELQKLSKFVNKRINEIV